MKAPKVLVVDDEQGIQESLKMILKEDYHVFTAPNGEEAFKVLSQESPDLVLLDVLLPGMGGIEILKKVKVSNPQTQVIMVTGQGKLKTAVEAIKLGAFDYIHKPFDIEELRRVVKKAIEQRKFKESVDFLKVEAKRSSQFDGIVGFSQKMKDLFEIISRVMNSNSNVLITGESGTGKELVARALHYNGVRKEGPFVVVHTSAIPDKLLESELFGHEKGAFTEEFRRVGGIESIHVDVRFVAATNKNLEKAIQSNDFREDLYYRLSVVPIVLPPLRDRREDIPLLVYHFLERNRANNKNTKVEGFSQEALDALSSYDWPGNVRELQNVIENLVVMSDRYLIQIEDLPQTIRMNQLQKTFFNRSSQNGASLEEVVAAFEKQLISEALQKCNGVYTRAAKLLGTTRRILKYRIDQLQIVIEKRRRRVSKIKEAVPVSL